MPVTLKDGFSDVDQWELGYPDFIGGDAAITSISLYVTSGESRYELIYDLVDGRPVATPHIVCIAVMPHEFMMPPKGPVQ